MNRNKEAGFTLIEVLAVTIISAIAMIFIYSIISQSTTTYQKQTNTNKEINDAAYTLKVITKDLRKTTAVVIGDNCQKLTLTTNDGDTSFTFKDNAILKDGIPLVKDIKSFTVTNGLLDENNSCTPSVNSNLISINIATINDRIYSTEIYLRKEN